MRFDVFGCATTHDHGFEKKHGYDLTIQAYTAGETDECYAQVEFEVGGHATADAALRAAMVFAEMLHPELAAKVRACVVELGKGGIEEHRVDMSTPVLDVFERDQDEG